MWAILLNIVLIIGLQIFVYIVFLRRKILTWGATPQEAVMPLPGDEQAHHISATRAITIDAPIAQVWQWVIQLGADRGGFFSYELLEKTLGYEFRAPESTPEFQDMPVGRVVPASLDESKSFIKFNFPVLAVEPGQSYVLKGWGAFVLKAIDPTHTRLIVRTHGQDTPTLLSQAEDFFGVATHYIMERRMLMGFKAQIETGKPLPSARDNLWLLGLFLSAIIIAMLVLLGGGIQTIWLSAVFSVAWLWVLLIAEPRPVYSLTLLVMIAVTVGWRHG